MTIAFVFESDLDESGYDQFMEAIRRPPGSDLPPGAVAHMAGPVGGRWRMVDMWESEEQAQAFYAEARTHTSGVPGIASHQWPLHRLEMASRR